jgi:hypothetical protein
MTAVAINHNRTHTYEDAKCIEAELAIGLSVGLIAL